MSAQHTRKLFVSGLLGVGVALGSSPALANHIDFLDDPSFTLVASGSGSSTLQTTALTGNTLGGLRDVTLFASTGGVRVLLADSNPGVVGDVDALSFRSDDEASQGTLTVLLGGVADLDANFLDIPMSTFDWDRVRVNFGLGSSSSASVAVTLFSREDGGTATVTKAFGGGDNDLDFLHSEFTAVNGSVDPDFLRNVDRATLTLIGGAGSNYFIESFNRNGRVDPTVPEPGTMLLLAGALAAFGLRKRRI
ncbi:MAG: PEP-CTERM sorting domain-containing protein [Acidobacteria bacterium]|nr:PEP-CTERM sorting domain-containing protein [Acidobacteriota bacterium]